MHECIVDDPSCCALCRRRKFYRRLRQNQGMTVADASRISGEPPSSVSARMAVGHLTEYTGRS